MFTNEKFIKIALEQLVIDISCAEFCDFFKSMYRG